MSKAPNFPPTEFQERLVGELRLAVSWVEPSPFLTVVTGGHCFPGRLGRQSCVHVRGLQEMALGSFLCGSSPGSQPAPQTQ